MTAPPPAASFVLDSVSVDYDTTRAIDSVNLQIPAKRVTALIGPSGCGKSTLLRCLNRMNDEIKNCHVSGAIQFEGRDITAPSEDVTLLRTQVGMVFQKPNPFPKSIFQNVAYGPRLLGLVDNRRALEDLVEQSLRDVALWDEVKNRLHARATELSGGQQQRLCIARAIAVKPIVLLMDEPCSALDPVATAHIESLIDKLAETYTIVIVTHSMQQAARVTHQTAFFYLGKLIEVAPTVELFTNPRQKRTEDYITGRFG